VFVLSGASAVVVAAVLPGCAAPQKMVQVSNGRHKVCNLGDLAEGKLLDFEYPDPSFGSNFIVKLGEKAGGGIGPNGDIVAFNSLCTHMGGPLTGTYKHAHRAIGPCPFHLTTFDLTRFGIVIAGHATESLPQVRLEVSGGQVYAVGFQGLVYGRHQNA